MGRGTRLLIAVLTGLLTSILLLMATYTATAVLGSIQMNALISQISANPDAYGNSTPAVITTTANGTVLRIGYQMGSTSDAILLQTLGYAALAGLGGLLTALAMYRLLAHAPVRE